MTGGLGRGTIKGRGGGDEIHRAWEDVEIDGGDGADVLGGGSGDDTLPFPDVETGVVVDAFEQSRDPWTLPSPWGPRCSPERAPPTRWAAMSYAADTEIRLERADGTWRSLVPLRGVAVASAAIFANAHPLEFP
jgi:hypothetical protein